MWTYQIRPTDTQVSHEHINVAWTSNLTLFCNTGGDATSLYLTGNTIQNHCKPPCQHLLSVNPPMSYNIAKRVWTLFAPLLRSLTHTNVFFLPGKPGTMRREVSDLSTKTTRPIPGVAGCSWWAHGIVGLAWFWALWGKFRATKENKKWCNVINDGHRRRDVPWPHMPKERWQVNFANHFCSAAKIHENYRPDIPKAMKTVRQVIGRYYQDQV